MKDFMLGCIFNFEEYAKKRKIEGGCVLFKNS